MREVQISGSQPSGFADSTIPDKSEAGFHERMGQLRGSSRRNYNPFLPEILGSSAQRIVTRREEETASPKEGRARRETIGTDMTLPRETGEATVQLKGVTTR